MKTWKKNKEEGNKMNGKLMVTFGLIALALGLYRGCVKINKNVTTYSTGMSQSEINDLIESYDSNDSVEVKKIELIDRENSELGITGVQTSRRPELDTSKLKKIALENTMDIIHNANLQKAIMDNDTDTVRELVDKKSGLSFEAPVCYAVSYGNIEIVQILLDAGVDANQKNNAGKTAIMIAREQMNDELIKILQDAGAVD
jgi:hypothetical protein